MGFLDRFKLRRTELEERKIRDEAEEVKKQKKLNIIINEDGKIQIEFNTEKTNFMQEYNTTRFVVDYTRGEKLVQGRVSWYNKEDAVMFDENGNEDDSRTDYSEILLELNMDLLKNDYNYAEKLMKDLLEKNRVNSYLERGMEENSTVPCGNYIGGIIKDDVGYRKSFNVQIGRAVHNSEEMKRKREDFTAMKQKEIEARKKELKIKMQGLQNELNSLEEK